MTAAEIGKALGLPSVKVNYAYREWCDFDYYSGENPIPKLLINIKSKDTI